MLLLLLLLQRLQLLLLTKGVSLLLLLLRCVTINGWRAIIVYLWHSLPILAIR